MKGKKAVLYLHRELMKFALTNYNNEISLKVWHNPDEREKDEKFLYFVTEIKQEILEIKKRKIDSTSLIRKSYENKYSWKHRHPNVDKTITHNGSTFY